MIENTQKSTPSVITPPRIAVLGLGCGGIRVLSTLSTLPAAGKLHLLAIDTDAACLASSPLPEACQLLADPQWRNGRGCGGDPLKGQRSIARERGKLESLLTGFDYIVILGGLGGGFASGAVTSIAGLAGKLKIPAIELLTLPFSWEGHARRKIADAAIDELSPAADALMLLPNDLLFSVLSPETPAEQAFQLADAELSRAAVAVCEMLFGRNLIPADFSDISELLRVRKNYCAIGVGVAALAESENAGQLAIDRMLCSPLLGGVGKLREADAILVSVLGGPELSIARVQETMQAANKCYGENAHVIMAINTSAEYANCILCAAIAVKYAEKPKRIAPNAPTLQEQPVDSLFPNEVADNAAGTAEACQLTLEFTPPPVAKGIFFNSPQVTFKGEDLDVPTFQRREVQIDRGDA